MNTFELDNKYVAQTYRRFPVEIVSGKGAVAYDVNGKKYIDMGSGIATNTFGLCDKEWCSAVEEQIHKFQHTSNLYYSEPCATLAEVLCHLTKALELPEVPAYKEEIYVMKPVGV